MSGRHGGLGWNSTSGYHNELSALITEVGIIVNNPEARCINLEAMARHVSGDNTLFPSFKEVAWGEKLYIGNVATVNINGEELMMSSVASNAFTSDVQ